MKVTITNKESFDELMRRKGINDDNVETLDKNFFISITEPDEPNMEPYFKTNHSNVIRLFFDDCNEDFEVKYTDGRPNAWARAMTKAQANELVDFIIANQYREACIVHCAAGISRSGAVGTFLNDLFGEPFFEFKKRNPYIHPNSHVLSLLRSVMKVQECDTSKAEGSTKAG